MRVRVRLFAGTRDAVGAPDAHLDLPEEARLRDALDRLCAAHPRLAPYRPTMLLALDGAFATPDSPLHDGAEIALMPPVSGGAERVAIVEGPLRLDPLVAALETQEAGAVVAFLGLVRPTSHERPRAQVERLHFEAHEAMALSEMARLRREAIARFHLADLIIHHRLGTLPLGEATVAVAAAAPHRRAAFDAAQWVMDELKTRIPIWKQEIDRDGSKAWVNDPTRRDEHA